MPVIGSVALPCERSSLQPDDTRFTLIDHEQDWAGFAESLTWSQLYRRTLNVTQGATPLVNYGVPRSLTVCTVDPLTRIEGPPGTAGEIWPHGRNIAIGYRRKPQETEIRSVEGLPLHRLARARGLGCAPGNRDSSLTMSCSSSATSRAY
jgi:acyl-CoA synthetase (AMP-forming)/AMP-acid ligase II